MKQCSRNLTENKKCLCQKGLCNLTCLEFPSDFICEHVIECLMQNRNNYGRSETVGHTEESIRILNFPIEIIGTQILMSIRWQMSINSCFCFRVQSAKCVHGVHLQTICWYSFRFLKYALLAPAQFICVPPFNLFCSDDIP